MTHRRLHQIPSAMRGLRVRGRWRAGVDWRGDRMLLRRASRERHRERERDDTM